MDIKEPIKQIAVGVGLACIFLGLPFYSIWVLAKTPDVLVSHSTGKCVGVRMPDGTIKDCLEMPEKYNMVYVP